MPNINYIDSEMALNNDQDRTRLDSLENKLDALSASVTRLLNAVIGDEVAGNYGIVSRLSKVETEHKAIDKRVEKLEGTTMRIMVWATAIAFLVSSLWQAAKLMLDLWTK